MIVKKGIDLNKKFLKKIEPFMAIGIFLMLIIVSYQLVQYSNKQDQIIKTTGWEDSNIRCWCSKDFVIMNENREKDIENKKELPQNISWSSS